MFFLLKGSFDANQEEGRPVQTQRTAILAHCFTGSRRATDRGHFTHFSSINNFDSEFEKTFSKLLYPDKYLNIIFRELPPYIDPLRSIVTFQRIFQF